MTERGMGQDAWAVSCASLELVDDLHDGVGAVVMALVETGGL